MSRQVKLACNLDIVTLSVNKILPTRIVDARVKRSSKFKCIKASLKKLGIIEPLIVFPSEKQSGSYMLLDGHVRLEICKEIGQVEVKCIVSTDDEGYTYNQKVSRLTAIQEHFMILRAIKSGVSEIEIADSLDVDVTAIRRKRDLLDGICPEAVSLLRHTKASGVGLRELRRVKPLRQIEIAELMCATHNFSISYAKCLVATTPAEQLVDGDRPKLTCGLTSDEIARMEHEMETLGKEFKIIEESHGRNVLNFVVVNGYLRTLLDNVRVFRFLSQHYPEIAVELQKIAESRNLATESGAA